MSSPEVGTSIFFGKVNEATSVSGTSSVSYRHLVNEGTSSMSSGHTTAMAEEVNEASGIIEAALMMNNSTLCGSDRILMCHSCDNHKPNRKKGSELLQAKHK